MLLELLSLDEPVDVAPFEPTGVPPTLLRADHLLEGLLLRLTQANQFLLDLLLRFVQIGIESRLAESMETALKLGNGVLGILWEPGPESGSVEVRK